MGKWQRKYQKHIPNENKHMYVAYVQTSWAETAKNKIFFQSHLILQRWLFFLFGGSWFDFVCTVFSFIVCISFCFLFITWICNNALLKASNKTRTAHNTHWKNKTFSAFYSLSSSLPSSFLLKFLINIISLLLSIFFFVRVFVRCDRHSTTFSDFFLFYFSYFFCFFFSFHIPL